jgi:hypothetical protein
MGSVDLGRGMGYFKRNYKGGGESKIFLCYAIIKKSKNIPRGMVVNFTNILHAAFPSKSFCQKLQR